MVILEMDNNHSKLSQKCNCYISYNIYSFKGGGDIHGGGCGEDRSDLLTNIWKEYGRKLHTFVTDSSSFVRLWLDSPLAKAWKSLNPPLA